MKRIKVVAQQTFNLMKTSWKRLSSLPSEDVFKTSSRLLDQDEYICLSHKSSEDVFKTSSRHFQHFFKTSCQDLFRTFSGRLQDVLQKWLQDIFKASSRHFEDVFKISLRYLQDILLRRLGKKSRHLQDVFKAFWRRLQDILKTSSNSAYSSVSLRSQNTFFSWNRKLLSFFT